jgi:hypothetical protein
MNATRKLEIKTPTQFYTNADYIAYVNKRYLLNDILLKY